MWFGRYMYLYTFQVQKHFMYSHIHSSIINVVNAVIPAVIIIIIITIPAGGAPA